MNKSEQSPNKSLTADEVAELRRLVDAGLRKVSNISLEELERISGPLKASEIAMFAAIGSITSGDSSDSHQSDDDKDYPVDNG